MVIMKLLKGSKQGHPSNIKYNYYEIKKVIKDELYWTHDIFIDNRS